MAADDLKRIYIDGGQSFAPPPGFVLDATIPPVPPPPPDGYVPDTAAPYKAPVDATPNPDDVMEDDTASPYRDARVPDPPAGFVPDVSADQHPQGRGILQALKDYPLHVVQGLWDTVKKPGEVMTPNPYPEGSEEAQFFEDSRQKAITQAAPELAMMALKPSVAGVRLPAALSPKADVPPPPEGFVPDSEPAAAGPARVTIDQPSSVTDAPAASPESGPEKIDSAAIRLNGTVYTGNGHFEAIENAAKRLGVSVDDLTNKLDDSQDLDGFFTNTGRYVSREEAHKIAQANDQYQQGVSPADKQTTTEMLDSNKLKDVGDGDVHPPELRDPTAPGEALPPETAGPLKAAAKVVKNIFSPDTVSPVAQGAAADIRSAGGQAARDTATTRAALDAQSKIVSKLPDDQKLGLVDYIENRSKLTGELPSDWKINVTKRGAGIMDTANAHRNVVVKDGTGRLIFDAELVPYKDGYSISPVRNATLGTAAPVRGYGPALYSKLAQITNAEGKKLYTGASEETSFAAQQLQKKLLSAGRLKNQTATPQGGLIAEVNSKITPAIAPGLKPVADTIRSEMQKRVAKLQALPSVDQMDFIEDYYPHMWQDPAKAASFVQEYTGGAARQGSGASLKKRTMPTIADGIAAGLKPISLDPIETSMRYVQSMDRFIATQQVLDKAVADGNIKYVKPRVMGASGNPEGYQVPPGWQPINGRGSTNANGARAYAPEDFARVYNNFIDQGVYRNADWGKVYDAARNASNAVTSLELGLSGFHAATMAQESVVNGVAKGIGELAAGKPLEALKSIAAAPAKPVTNILKGRQVEKTYLNQSQGTPLVRQITDLLTEAGGRAKGSSHAPDYRYSQAGSYWDSFKRGTIMAEVKAAGQTIKASPITGPIKVTMQQVGRIMSTVAKPLFEYAIPKLKNGAFFDNMSSWLKANPNATHEMQVKAARDIWDSIDNRFGEMVSDNIFWNKTLKQSLQVALRSYSWTTGTIRELGGGAAQLARHPSSLSPKSPHYSPKAAYVIALPITYATLNAVYQYLKTGQSPESISDVMRGGLTGGTAPAVGGQGTVPERAMLPGYMKDVFGWYFDPVQEGSNKVATLLRMGKESIGNKDWKGQPIRNPEDPTVDQVREYLQYVYKSMGPISIKQMLKGQKTGSNISLPEAYLGLHPAPSTLQDPIGLDNAMRSIHDREWAKKQGYDKKQDAQYGGPSPGVPVKPLEPAQPKAKRSHHRKD